MVDRTSDSNNGRDPNSGHGHVYKRPDGVKARCGGPPMCSECTRDMVALQAAHRPQTPIAPLPSNECDAWILWFSDIDREQVHFHGHGAKEAALKAYEHAKMAWTCRLYHCVAHSGYGPETAHDSVTHETDELLSIVRDISTMDCFWSASGHHEADCKCLSGRAERAVAAHTQKAEVGESFTKRREYHANGTYWSGVPTIDMPCDFCGLAITDHDPRTHACPTTGKPE